MQPTDFQSEATQHDDDRVSEASDILNSTEMEADDLGLSGYVQDNFEFLDQMDCSALDHMDCSVSYQVCVTVFYLYRQQKIFLWGEKTASF